MNNRTEEKLKDISGMSKAVNELLHQAWERGYKYGLRKGYESGLRDKETECMDEDAKQASTPYTYNAPKHDWKCGYPKDNGTYKR